MADQSRSLQSLSGSDNATALPPALGRRGRYDLQGQTPLPEFDPSKVMPELLDHLRKVGVQDPEQLIRNVQQGKYDGETSSEQEEYRKHKGRDPLSSNGEKIDTLRSLMDKLNDKKVRERSLLERDSEIPAARTLLSDKKSTCHDPCSDTPASVDCMKQCTTTVSSDTSACLDVSISDVLAKVEPVPGLQAPNQQVRLNYTLSVQNNCPETIKDVTYQIQGTGECPLPSTFIPAPDTGVYIQSFSADPSSVAPLETLQA